MATPQPQQPQVYYGEQIKSEHQGDLAAIVADFGLPSAGAFVYPIDSAEFKHVTGLGSTRVEVARVYIGINPVMGRRVALVASTLIRRTTAPAELRSLDEEIVNAHFLREEQAVPARAQFYFLDRRFPRPLAVPALL
ncbi:MAG: hypothetical protein HYT16_01440 [DPANN group archaeon]|nr:hypothetical protein [DPANN group archaeon]